MMSKEKLFSHPRWEDIPEGKTIGKVEFSEKEKEKNKKKLQDHLKKIGVMKKE
jgi:hypothetical protein